MGVRTVEGGGSPNVDITCILKFSFSCYCRMAHPGKGLPADLIEDMCDGENQWSSQEGLGLKLSRKLLIMMNGQVNYVREQNKCYFLIELELKNKKRKT